MISNTTVDATSHRDDLMSVTHLRLERLKKLIELAEEQRSILLQGRNSDLPENVRAQDMALAELAHLQKREDALIETLSAEANAGPDVKREHVALSAKASRAAQRLQTVVRGNRQLLDNAMQYVSFSLGVISELASNQQPGYDTKSDGPSNSLAILLDRKV